MRRRTLRRQIPCPSPPPEARPYSREVDRQISDEILTAHEMAVLAGQAGYTDPSSGLFVFTAVYLLERGTCCDQGCRHCPYVK